jgi:hypothetical protein
MVPPALKTHGFIVTAPGEKVNFAIEKSDGEPAKMTANTSLPISAKIIGKHDGEPAKTPEVFDENVKNGREKPAKPTKDCGLPSAKRAGTQRALPSRNAAAKGEREKQHE